MCGTWLSLWESCRRSRLRGESTAIPQGDVQSDGAQHYAAQVFTYDSELSDFPEALDLGILRFSNRVVDRIFYDVFTKIDSTIQKTSAKPSQSPAVTALPKGEPRRLL